MPSLLEILCRIKARSVPPPPPCYSSLLFDEVLGRPKFLLGPPGTAKGELLKQPRFPRLVPLIKYFPLYTPPTPPIEFDEATVAALWERVGASLTSSDLFGPYDLEAQRRR